MRSPIDNLALSNAVRPGVVGWMKTLAREVGPKGITVNTIAPGRIDTERLRSLGGDARRLADPARAARRAGRDRRRRLLPRLRPRGATSPGRSCRSTAASRATCSDQTLRLPSPAHAPRQPGADPARRDRGGPLDRPLGRLPPPSRQGAAGRAARPGPGREGSDGPGGIYYDAVIVRRAQALRAALPVDPRRRRRSSRRSASTRPA